MKTNGLLVAGVLLSVASMAPADLVRGIDISFVPIGHAGNAGDTRPEAKPNGCGAVGYAYQIGKYEITNAQWTAFVLAAGAPAGNPSTAYDEPAYWNLSQQPANNVSWYEAAQFCNYLTSGNKSLGAYQLDPGGSILVNRNWAVSAYGTAYVIPTEDEWYKAAYFKPDGSGYSLFANGQSTIPPADSVWNYINGGYYLPWNIRTVNITEQNGTFDMMGNIAEWTETLVSTSNRVIRGGSYADYSNYLSSSDSYSSLPNSEDNYLGFRIAAIPEPCSIALLGLCGLAMTRRRRST